MICIFSFLLGGVTSSFPPADSSFFYSTCWTASGHFNFSSHKTDVVFVARWIWLSVFCFVFLVVVLVVSGRHICLTKRRCIKNTWTSCDLLVIWSPNEKKSRTSHDDITINKVPLVEMCHQTFHVFWSIKENIQHAIWNMMQQKFDWLKPARQKETVKDANIFINQIVPTQLLWCWRTLWYYLHTSAAHSHRS